MRYGIVLDRRLTKSRPLPQFQIMQALVYENRIMIDEFGRTPAAVINNRRDMNRFIREMTNSDKIIEKFNYPDSATVIAGFWQ